MKKFLSILASAAVLSMPLAVISTPAAAHTGAPAVKAKQVKAKATHKAQHAKAKAKAKVKIAPKAA